jgi:histone-lysine N-methyltransferase SETMAR
MLSRGVVMLHDNARPHTAAATQDLIPTFGWEQFDHASYSPDLAPTDFYMCLQLKTFLGVRRGFASQAASFYDAGIQKLVPRYHKCLTMLETMSKNSVRYVHQIAT